MNDSICYSDFVSATLLLAKTLCEKYHFITSIYHYALWYFIVIKEILLLVVTLDSIDLTKFFLIEATGGSFLVKMLLATHNKLSKLT